MRSKLSISRLLTSRLSISRLALGVSALAFILCAGLFSIPKAAVAQNLKWTVETADTFGKSMSLAIDKDGNVHMSYLSGDKTVKYGFRSSHNGKWFSLDIAPSAGYSDLPTKIALDPQGNPHMCFTPAVMKYASFDGKKWNVQQIDPGAGLIEFNCSVAIGSDGIPQVSWYQYSSPDSPYYLHIKYAELVNGVWQARTLDYEGQTGKWNSMVVDSQNNPHLSYDSFLKGELKSAYNDGKQWKVSVIDSREAERGNGAYNRGMGNSILVNSKNLGQIAYEYDDTLLYAWQTDTGWRHEVVDHISTTGSWIGYHTRQAFDPQGRPHIVYDDAGMVKHAYWDGTEWQIQVVSGRGIERARYPDIAIDSTGTTYIAYRDANDGSLKVAVGKAEGQSGTVKPAAKSPAASAPAAKASAPAAAAAPKAVPASGTAGSGAEASAASPKNPGR
jgi:hypothetical protein